MLQKVTFGIGTTRSKGIIYVSALGLILGLALSLTQVAVVHAEEDDADENAFQKLAGIVESFLKVAISSTINIARLLYCAMAIVGAVLWTSRLDRMTGRDLIIGAVILAFVSEFIMPVVLLS